VYADAGEPAALAAFHQVCAPGVDLARPSSLIGLWAR